MPFVVLHQAVKPYFREDHFSGARPIGGVLSTTPTAANIEGLCGDFADLDARLAKRVYALDGHGKYAQDGTMELLARWLMMIDGWLSAFKECDDAARYIAIFCLELASWYATLEVTPEQVAEAMEPWMAYTPTDNAYWL